MGCVFLSKLMSSASLISAMSSARDRCMQRLTLLVLAFQPQNSGLTTTSEMFSAFAPSNTDEYGFFVTEMRSNAYEDFLHVIFQVASLVVMKTLEVKIEE